MFTFNFFNLIFKVSELAHLCFFFVVLVFKKKGSLTCDFKFNPKKMSQLQEKHDKLVKFVNKTLKLFKSYIEYNQNMMLEFKSLQHMGLDLDLDICIDNFDSNLNEIDMIKDELQFEHSINGELSKHEDIQNDQYLKDFDELLNNTETDEYNQSDNYDNQNSNLPYQPLISEPNNVSQLIRLSKIIKLEASSLN